MKEFIENRNNPEYFKGIEIPKEELEIAKDIFDFAGKISSESFEDYDIGEANSLFTVEEIIERKTNESTSAFETLSEDEQLNLRRKIKREAEYEAYRGDIDFKNAQFEKLTRYIESKSIWKCKFSTNHAFYLGQYHELNFKGDASESREYDEHNSFAGQGRDSIYYVSNSGMSLRLKKDLLMTENIKNVLQKPQELILFFNQREKQRQDLDTKETFHDIEGVNSIDFPAELVSFEPKLEYNVEEFTRFDFYKNHDFDYKSAIEVVKNGARMIIKNYDNNHAGHQVNKIYFQNK